MEDGTSLKTVVDIIDSVVGTIAILLGGWWTYTLFVRQRQGHTKGVVSHKVEAHLLDAERRRIRVEIELKNIGTVAINPPRAETSIQQVLPLTTELTRRLSSGESLVPANDVEIDWELLARHEHNLKADDWIVEPGEHERIYCDFIIPATVTMVEIHTMVQCSADQNSQHWEDEVLVNIAEAAPAKVGGPNTPLLARGGQ